MHSYCLYGITYGITVVSGMASGASLLLGVLSQDVGYIVNG